MSEREPHNELVRIYSQVLSKRSNLPAGAATPEQAEEFNVLVDRAAAVRHEDLEEFRIRDSDILRPPFPGRSGGKPHVELTTYTERLDSFPGYVRGTLPAETVTRMGFVHE